MQSPQVGASAPRYRFAGLEFDPDRGLERGGQWYPLGALQRRLLTALLEADGKVVAKHALVQDVWPHTEVSDDSISSAVFRLRKQLADAGGLQVVATVYGGGFRVSVPITRTGAVGPGPAPDVADTTRATAVRECIATARELMGRRGFQDMVSASLVARRALRLDRRSVDAWNLLAQISALRLNRGQYDVRSSLLRRVRWTLRHALDLAPDDSAALGLQGYITAVYDREFTPGLALLDRAITEDDANWMVHMYRAWALHAANRRDEGLAAFQAMSRRNPLSTYSIGVHAYALACAGRVPEALAMLDQAIKQMPTIDSLYFARSTAAAIAGDTVLALRDAKRCAALAPDVPNQLCALACVKAQLGDRREARRLLHNMTRMRSRLAPSWHALALSILGARPEAEEIFRRARSDGCAWIAFVQFDPRVRPTRSGQPLSNY